MAVGWHFLYEGLSKLFADEWSAASYIINLLFIETAILVFFFFHPEKGYGLDDLIPLLRKKKPAPVGTIQETGMVFMRIYQIT